VFFGEAAGHNPDFAQPYAGRGALPHTPRSEASIIHYSFFIIHYSLSLLPCVINPSYTHPDAGRGALPHTPQTFGKKFDQKLYQSRFLSCLMP
jgi:hypothetical protein